MLKVQNIHKILNEGKESREAIVNKINETRKFITSLILSYELIYGAFDKYEEEQN